MTSVVLIFHHHIRGSSQGTGISIPEGDSPTVSRSFCKAEEMICLILTTTYRSYFNLKALLSRGLMLSSHALHNCFKCCGNESFDKAGYSSPKSSPEQPCLWLDPERGRPCHVLLAFLSQPLKPWGRCELTDQR